MTFRCCLETPDPGPWTAGSDDTADPRMIEAMHMIRDRMAAGGRGGLGNDQSLDDLIWSLKAAVNIDNRTLLGRDIQRCLLSNAADRLLILEKRVDPHPWKTWADRLKDAWDVLKGRAVSIRVRRGEP